ncbi:hypothetical protein BJ875DRAFT_241514 [Amylocarpus encephaloides]|uniref:Zn(2)-C6 fungal-type domain-containing protein n=1 Tax=Amylocarpus encephaloides TaxID=45428 RepID=A0A9P7YN66_9HELO|nr:hypothetical protein BJ875DRAFT_241514 [Amylocarpus encephaloides]
MTADFVTKRAHKKSRAGCQTCKTKRVKCDEAVPKCGFCEKRDFTCLYTHKSPRSSSSSTSSLSPSPNGFHPEDRFPADGIETMDDESEFWSLVIAPQPVAKITTPLGALTPTDLRLMHHWSTSTWNTLAIGKESSNLLLVDIPPLAFENEYLLNCILGIASLHREHGNPGNEVDRKTTAVYRVKALNGFRQAIAHADSKPLNWEAALIMAILLLCLCSKDHIYNEDLTVVNWLVFYRGLSAIITMKSYEAVRRTLVSPIFQREITKLRIVPVIPTILINLLEGIGPLDPDFEFLEHYCQALDSLGILYASLRQDGIAPELWIRVVTWPSFTKQPFAECGKERRPRALVLLAHFLCFVKLIKGLWWLENMPDTEIRMIMDIIGPQWERYMLVPLEAITLPKKEDIANLLLR